MCATVMLERSWLVALWAATFATMRVRRFEMFEMGEAALENGWPPFTSQRRDELAKNKCVKNCEKRVKRSGKRQPA